jgi:23S rRNA pseudouridine1911/1915/1917 synthase
MEEIFTCLDGQSERADKLLAQKYTEFSRSFIKQSIDDGKITRIDGSSIEPKTKLSPGDQLRICLVRPTMESLIPYDHNLDVLFEDEHILVINKEAGMVVHPGDGTDGKTLVHALLHHCPDQLSPVGAPLRPGIVHRLDKDTSGVMVIAKTEAAHLSLADQFANRQTSKVYQAIACGKLGNSGEFNQPIARHPTVRIKMAVSEKGKSALTLWKTKRVYRDSFSHVECKILTGRTHQIRVHFSANGHPLAGDTTYGYRARFGGVRFFPRVMLHAWKLSIEHPESREALNFCAPLPEDFSACLASFSDGGND